MLATLTTSDAYPRSLSLPISWLGLAVLYCRKVYFYEKKAVAVIKSHLAGILLD
jgi:hypothetical protein